MQVHPTGKPPLRADHIGSLLRPPALRHAFRQHAAGEIDDAAFRRVQDESIEAVVRLQQEVGLAVVTDGEFRRGSYWSRFVERTEGLRVRDAVFKFRDDDGHEQSFTASHVTGKVERRQPIVIVCCSGGARMMEGALSLMQMAKVCGALARLHQARLPYIAVLTDPTTGGVTASFAMLGDFIVAEPKALIGFAGPRTIWNTIKVELPEGFQRSEFLKDHGFVDFVVHRKDLRSEIARLVDFCGK